MRKTDINKDNKGELRTGTNKIRKEQYNQNYRHEAKNKRNLESPENIQNKPKL